MKRADSCKHRQAVKNIQFEKTLFKSHLHSSKLRKRVEKHGASIKMPRVVKLKLVFTD